MTRLSRRGRGVAANAVPAIPAHGEPLSLIEEYEAEPGGAQEMAAAQLALSVRVLLRAAFDASGSTASDLAKTLAVSESAVSQVLNSDGNLRISTIGRYLRGLGYQGYLAGRPATPASPPIHCELPFLWRDSRASFRHMLRDSAGAEWATHSNVLHSTPGRMVIETVATRDVAAMDQSWSPAFSVKVGTTPNVLATTSHG